MLDTISPDDEPACSESPLRIISAHCDLDAERCVCGSLQDNLRAEQTSFLELKVWRLGIKCHMWAAWCWHDIPMYQVIGRPLVRLCDFAAAAGGAAPCAEPHPDADVCHGSVPHPPR